MEALINIAMYGYNKFDIQRFRLKKCAKYLLYKRHNWKNAPVYCLNTILKQPVQVIRVVKKGQQYKHFLPSIAIKELKFIEHF